MGVVDVILICSTEYIVYRDVYVVYSYHTRSLASGRLSRHATDN